MLDKSAGDLIDATVVADAAAAADGRPYRLEYEFDGVVAATWVYGPLKGTLPVKSSIKEFTFQKWKTVDAIHTYGVAFDAATPDELLQAVFDFVADHCESMLQLHGLVSWSGKPVPGSCSMQRARRGGCGLTPLAGATMGSTVVDLTPQSWNSLRSREAHSTSRAA